MFKLRLTADEAIEQFNLHYNLMFEDAPLHTNVLLVNSGEYFYQNILDAKNKDVQITIAQPESESVLWKYFVLGIEHILTGYDHLLFLLSLVLIASRYKDALKIVSAFYNRPQHYTVFGGHRPYSGQFALGRSLDCPDDLLCGSGKYVCSKGEMAVAIDGLIFVLAFYWLIQRLQ